MHYVYDSYYKFACHRHHFAVMNIYVLGGTNGVFDIEELVTLLKKDKAKDIFVASVPKEYAYVDYIVVVTGKSPKHMSMLATFVRKVYKLKRHPTDLLPRIEGKDSRDWIALDLGMNSYRNICIGR